MENIDIKDMSSDELIMYIEEKNKKILMKEKEIDKIVNSKVKKSSIESPEEKKSTNYDSNSTDILDVNISFEDEVDYYFDLLDDIKDSDELKSEIRFNLPSKNAHNYKNLMTRIKIEFLKNIRDIEEIIFEDDTLDKGDLEEFKKEIILCRKKIEYIKEIEDEKELVVSDFEVNNNLIFDTTSSGNIRLIEEFNHISKEYYDKFLELLLSIKNGTFKNVKRFKSNNKLVGITEVKDFKIRIVFDRLDFNNYAVISAFVKKTDIDKSYRNSLFLKIQGYREKKKDYKNLIDNQEFLDEQKNIEEEIIRILSGSEKSNNCDKVKKYGK